MFSGSNYSLSDIAAVTDGNRNDGMWGGDVIREHEHDPREGKSGIHRKSYMESKALGKTEDMTKQELETYMKELGMDIAEIVSSATPAERSMLKQKLTEMASKVQ